MIMSKQKNYVRRGFDIDEDLYNRFRAQAARLGLKTKDYVSLAIQNQLKTKLGEKIKSGKTK